MITLTGTGRLTRDVALRSTRSGKTVATISIASDRRDRSADPVYVELIVWQAQATAAPEHLVNGQAVSFSGRFEPREYVTSSGENRVALELHGVDIEYGPKPRGVQRARALEPPTRPTRTTSRSELRRRAGGWPSGPPGACSEARRARVALFSAIAPRGCARRVR